MRLERSKVHAKTVCYGTIFNRFRIMFCFNNHYMVLKICLNNLLLENYQKLYRFKSFATSTIFAYIKNCELRKEIKCVSLFIKEYLFSQSPLKWERTYIFYKIKRILLYWVFIKMSTNLKIFCSSTKLY